MKIQKDLDNMKLKHAQEEDERAEVKRSYQQEHDQILALATKIKRYAY